MNTGNDKREQKDGDSKTHHFDDVQVFFNTGDDDADDDVADADDSYNSCIFGLLVNLISTHVSTVCPWLRPTVMTTPCNRLYHSLEWYTRV